MSPYILIDQQLEAFSDASTPADFAAIIQRQLNEMMNDERITIDEFHHYCGRLTKISDARKEAA